MQLKQVLAQVNEPTYQPYYQSRGKALLAWIAYATYQPTWAETALDKALATTAAWLTERGAALLLASPFVAVLDGRPCLVAASYYPSASSLAAGQPVAACYISYPEQEVRWRQFNLSAYAAPIPIAPPLPKPAEVATPAISADLPLATRRYLHLLSLILTRAWLVRRYPITPEDKTVATELQADMALLFPAALHTYYQQEAWQLLGWLARATG